MPGKTTNTSKKQTVYYDGSCPMCTVVVGAVDDTHPTRSYTKEDITTGAAPKGVTRQELDKEIYVVDEDGKTHKNIDAILELLASSKRWGWLAPLGRLPVVKQVLQLGYKIVAANRHFLFGKARALFWAKTVVIIGLALSLFESLPLWVGGGSMPRIPVFSWIPTLPTELDAILFGFILLGFIGALISAKPQRYMLLSVGVLVVFAVFDQMRWAPWAYQYGFMLFVMALFSWDHKDDVGKRVTMNTLRVVLVGVYIFAGLQKANQTFVQKVFPDLVEPVMPYLPVAIGVVLFVFGILVPFIEAAIGFGLLARRTRIFAALFAVSMHVLLVAVLGPFGYGWAQVIGAWNLALALLVMLLFAVPQDVTWKEILWQKRVRVHAVAVLLFLVLPITSFFGVWDSYLSFSLWSGNIDSGSVWFSDEKLNEVPEDVRKYVTRTTSGKNKLSIQAWAFGEHVAPDHPETRIHKAIARTFCDEDTADKDLMLTVKEKATVFHPKERHEYHCSDLMN